jgi:hypothetical protein
MVIMFYMIFGMQVPHLKIMYHVHHDPPIYDLDLKVELFSVGTITKYTYRTSHTVKPAHAFTSIKQSPVLKSHIFLVLSQKISYDLNLF